MSSITLKNLVKIYEGNVLAVDDLSMAIADREFIVLVGPSGCGKSTVLRMIAGLEEVTAGELYIGDKLMNDVPPRDRDIAMVFQNYALYPHMTTYKNMAFGLENRKIPKDIIDTKVRTAAKILNIEDILNRKPKAMSGGQRQRVALGRAIVREPAVFLLDEPLSNLDAKLRTVTRTEIIKLHKRLGATFVYVTHDQVEAMTMGDRIVVMKDGRAQQIGTPEEVYHQPANIFVAGFIGTPPMNFLKARVGLDEQGYFLQIDETKIHLPHPRQSLTDYLGQTLILGIRPDNIDIGITGLPAKVEVAEALGGETHIYLDYRGEKLIAKEQGSVNVQVDDLVRLYFAEDAIHLFDPDSGNNIAAAQ
ncbi:MAG: sn-glycerol-3-phosphate ABC transporter ATP-binding protein UgpC [Clostridia bacterium]|nr:sn-glycerol-3-phosphate ABC transporter ATP-binding protein UgpC [Clostridia bacterium]